MNFGFARVSSTAQDLTDQLTKLQAAGIERENIIAGKHSGKGDSNETALEALKAKANRRGDTVTVTKLDRLGRSLSQVIQTIEHFHSIGVNVVCLDQNIDTSDDSPMGKAMVHLLAMFAELERSFIQQRLEEGKAAAVASGKHTVESVKGGRPASYTDEQKQEVIQGIQSGAPIARLARETGLTRTTIYRIKEGIRESL